MNQQLRWHYHINSKWQHLQVVNKPFTQFLELQEHFQFNLDESCFM